MHGALHHHLAKQADIGLRWLRCGSRLFQRNPWLLAGMGLTAMVVIIVLNHVQLVGHLLIALLAPIFLASAYQAVDMVSKQKMTLPASLAGPAFVRSPKALLGAFGDESNLIPLFVTGILTLGGALLINILVHLLAGSSWVSQWSSLDFGAWFVVLGTALLALALYLLLTAFLIYSLPLVFLQGAALIPALGQSLRASARHLVGLLVILAVLLVPFILGGIAAYLSNVAGIVVSLLTGTIVLPLVVASAYCSYRTVFPSDSTPHT